ncbi:uncharacterized protein LOC123399731 [Hordeum vulgare subsp. vulgare]|uniref:uncharacterized protein LOC123399731 n=1 Tax=Hordeum vulgare subsp. vulgare TaxID=112509 RepID=UPI00162E9088|nr:uncharacterized protein LOC123399731 [Hordeum vulgare subsp. vulgare]
MVQPWGSARSGEGVRRALVGEREEPWRGGGEGRRTSCRWPCRGGQGRRITLIQARPQPHASGEPRLDPEEAAHTEPHRLNRSSSPCPPAGHRSRHRQRRLPSFPCAATPSTRTTSTSGASTPSNRSTFPPLRSDRRHCSNSPPADLLRRYATPDADRPHPVRFQPLRVLFPCCLLLRFSDRVAPLFVRRSVDLPVSDEDEDEWEDGEEAEEEEEVRGGSKKKAKQHVDQLKRLEEKLETADHPPGNRSLQLSRPLDTFFLLLCCS